VDFNIDTFSGKFNFCRNNDKWRINLCKLLATGSNQRFATVKNSVIRTREELIFQAFKVYILLLKFALYI